MPVVSQPVYSEIVRGVGIDPCEYETIKRISMQVYQSGINRMAKNVSVGIKQAHDEKWFSFVNTAGDETYKFSLTRVKKN